MGTIKEAFWNRGLRVNFKKTKTEAIPTCCGEGAKQIRKNLLTQPIPGVDVGEDGQKDFLRFQGHYKHLGTQHETAGGLGQEIGFRVGAAWSAFRSLRTILCRRSLPIQTRLGLLNSLILSKLFYGAGAWHPLSKQQSKKISTCYMNLVRQTVGQVYNGKTKRKVWSDSFLLQHYLLPDLRAILGEKRLLYARRVWVHGGKQLRDLLTTEAQVRKDSWMNGLDADIHWLIKLQGKSWGGSPEEIKRSWLDGRVGWKGFVKGALRRHILQEGIAELLCQEDKPDLTLEGAFACSCGVSFLTLRGLRTHQHKKHQMYSEEYTLCGGTVCPVCLNQFWTRGRLSQHLGYISTTNAPNPCFSYMKVFGFIRMDGEEVTELPLKGLNRREAIRISGPLPFGADLTDVTYAENRIASLEEFFAEKGFGHPDAHFDDDFMELAEITLEENRSNWAEAIETLAEMHQKEFFAMNVALIFAGAKVFGKDRAERDDWQAYLRGFDGGDELIEWFDLKLHFALLQRVKDAAPHREQLRRKPIGDKVGEAGGWERKIERCLFGPEGELSPEVEQVARPKASINLLQKTISRLR